MLPVTIDKAGRVVIPKNVRDELHLEAGDSLQLDCDGREMTLRPVPASVPLRKERGVWVYYGNSLTSAETEKLIDDARRSRDQQAAG